MSLVPGGTITYENRNLGGRAATVAASINTKSFLAPSDDISYRLMYQKPFIWGLSDENRTKLQATVFNARKLCGVFTPGATGVVCLQEWGGECAVVKGRGLARGGSDRGECSPASGARQGPATPTPTHPTHRAQAPTGRRSRPCGWTAPARVCS